MTNTKKTARTTFKAFCPKCSRGPFCVTKSGTIRKHACWTKVSESEVIRVSEQAERDALGKRVAREIAANRARLDRLDALKLAFAVCSIIMIFLGSCR